MDTPTITPELLKRQAKRLLLVGDVDRYLRTLGRIYAMRNTPRPALG
ncbi:MAG TPA: hypothetical protein PLL25_04095 [Flavobacteriales bacterium]|jgi:hypothetical protein|nr:hypothetical protein [Flavobacteriales bacterium]